MGSRDIPFIFIGIFLSCVLKIQNNLCYSGLRKYRGRLSFLPLDANYRLTRRHSYDDEGLSDSAVTRHPDTNCQRSVSLFDHGAGDAGKVEKQREKNSRKPGKHPIGKGTSGKGLTHTEPVGVAMTTQHTADAQRPDELSGDRSNTVETPLLAPLGEPVPANWTVLEDDFVLFVALYQTHIAQDMVAAPDSKLDDGVIHLLFVRGSVSRIKLIQLLNAMQAAQPPLDDPHVDFIKARAFRLEPLSNAGTMTVDGEVIEYGSVQAQVLPSMARVMNLQKNK